MATTYTENLNLALQDDKTDYIDWDAIQNNWRIIDTFAGGLDAVSQSDLATVKSQLEASIDAVTDAVAEILDSSGEKNLIPSGSESGTGTRYKDITSTFPVGQYVISFGSIASTDTDAETCQICAFTSGNSAASVAVQCERGSDKHIALTLVSEAAYIRIYASDTHAHGANDTITFSNAMLCKKVYYDVAPDYVPGR